MAPEILRNKIVQLAPREFKTLRESVKITFVEHFNIDTIHSETEFGFLVSPEGAFNRMGYQESEQGGFKPRIAPFRQFRFRWTPMQARIGVWNRGGIPRQEGGRKDFC